MNTPCKVRWVGPPHELSSPVDGKPLGTVRAGAECVLVYPGLVAFSPELSVLYQADAAHYEAVEDPKGPGWGGWDGTTVTPELVKTLLQQESAIPTLVQVMAEDPELGPKVVQGVMAGMS